MRSLAAAAVGFLVLTTALLGAPAQATGQLLAEPAMLRLDVTSMSPRIISDNSDTLLLTGSLTNISDRTISNVKARLQLGIPQNSATQLGQALTATAPVDSQLTPFGEVTPTLAPGASVTVRLSADLRGAPGGLTMPQPGVYPLLINVNGRPDFGGDARLAAVHLLLPVLAAPGGSGAEPAETPTEVSLLWPISSSPRVVAAPFGDDITLSDDDLAAEMRRGGRLHALVAAGEAARDEDIFDATCFAIDPALVATANAMTGGYQVRTGGGFSPGNGSDVAAEWLESLRTLVTDACVITLPYAGADIAPFAGELPTLARTAVTGDATLRELLGVTPLTDAFWPQHELTAPTLDALAAAGKNVLVADPAGLESEHPLDRPVELLTGEAHGTGQRAVPYDDLIALGFRPGSAHPEAGRNATTAADQRGLATQNALAAVAVRAAFQHEAPSRGLLVAPPLFWNASETELRWALNSFGTFADAGLVEPTPVRESLTVRADGTARAVAADAGQRVPPAIVQRIKRVENTIGDLLDSMDVDPTTQVEPTELVRPLRNALLRATSTSWRGSPELTEFAARDAEDQLRMLAAGVSVTDPGRTISLASGSSPIPVVVTNTLPVQVNVRVMLTNAPGLRPEDVPARRLPADSARTMRIPAEALRAGRFSVDVALSTPGGTELGDRTRFELASTEYGLITVIVTATAAGALLLLSGRRIYRRVRSGDSRTHHE